MFERDNRKGGDRAIDDRAGAGQAFLETGQSRAAGFDEEGRSPAPADAPMQRRSPAPAIPPFADEADDDRLRRRAIPDTRRGWLRRHPLAMVLALLCLLPALAAGYLYWDDSSHFEYTDDAYIAARDYGIAPEVSGYITAVPVTDNEHVAQGQVIARIDDRSYRAALAQAEAQVAAARANIENIDAQLAVQQARIAADQAQLSQQQAALVFAQQQAARYQYLAQTQLAGSVQSAQQYTAQLHEQQATVASAQANLKLAQRQVEALHAQRASAVASLAQATAQRDQARLNLDYTTVRAAQPGRIVELSAAVGQYAQPGTNLAMFVPDDIWIWANFKETQLARMRPGQPVTIAIDAYPEHPLRGHVASVQPGSGTAFSLLPAENATGNWVKIVQRVPVKIVIDHPPRDLALGPGMSTEVEVRVDPGPSLYRQLRQWL